MNQTSSQNHLTIFITGSSGFIGAHLTRSLLKAGHTVIAGIRNPKTFHQRMERVQVVEVDFMKGYRVSEWLEVLKGVDIVINTVGIIRETHFQSFEKIHNNGPISLFQACEEAGVKKVIQLSALGADDSAVSQYYLSKNKADRFLMELDVDWVILKPSLVYGPGSKSMTFFKALSSLPMVPIIDGGHQRVQPIYIDDLIKGIVQIVQSNKMNRLTLEIVGPERLTMKQIFKELSDWLGKGKIRFISVPFYVALWISWIGKVFQTPLVTPEVVRMLKQGNIGNISSFIQSFGFKPKAFNEALAEYPSQQSDRWHARLYFLSPLLRISIAFLWILSGIVSAFVYPESLSYTFLERVGIPDPIRPLALYGAALTDIGLGMTTLIGYRLFLTGIAQIGLILIYTVFISIGMPEFWIHPFGPISKNVPIVVATLIMISLEEP